MGYSPSDDNYHKVIGRLREDKVKIMSEYKLLEARICLKDLLIQCINTGSDAELYRQFMDGFLTTTQFVSQVGDHEVTDAQRYYLLSAFINHEEAQATHEMLHPRKPRNIKEVK